MRGRDSPYGRQQTRYQGGGGGRGERERRGPRQFDREQGDDRGGYSRDRGR